MNQIPLFSLCKASSVVTALLGSNPTKVYPFGNAPKNVTLPYATWQVVSGSPLNQLADDSGTDIYSTQVDVYAATPDEAIEVAKAIISATSSEAYVLSYNGNGRDNETEDYYYSFDLGWIINS